MTGSDVGHDQGSDIGVDAVPVTFKSPPSYDAVDDSSTPRDEGQDLVGTGPQPDGVSQPTHRRRWIVLAAAVVVIGIAAGAAAANRHTSVGPTAVAIPQQSQATGVAIPQQSQATGVDPDGRDYVTYEVTGSSHSANVRYTLFGTLTKEEDNLDLAMLSGSDSFPYLVETMQPRGSHVFVEVRNNLRRGTVACKIDDGLGIGSTSKTRSAQGGSIAICDVYLP